MTVDWFPAVEDSDLLLIVGVWKFRENYGISVCLVSGWEYTCIEFVCKCGGKTRRVREKENNKCM